MTPRTIVMILVLLLAGCAGLDADETTVDDFEPDETAAAFDLDLVKEAIAAECEVEPVLLDEQTCQELDSDSLAAAEMTLRVPTSLEADQAERAAAICEQIAEMRFFDEANEDVGFEAVEVLDAAGDVAAQCTAAADS
jgi:hypothetical protein